jgi:quercetin dioxygenase-like cupin family protein
VARTGLVERARARLDRHRHPHGLSVYLASQDTRITVDGRAPQVTHREAGSFAWSDAVVHTVENVGSTEMHVLRIELKP